MSPKVGRNQLCPCGSGKKYKKCCLPADEARESEALRARNQAAQQASTVASALSRSDPSKAKRSTDLGPQAQVAMLSTEQIFERLGALGVQTSADAFKELTFDRDRAWSIGEDVWLSSLSDEVDGEERQFICLAACELWQRLTEGPDAATRMRWLNDGQRHVRDGESIAACDVWLPLWRWIRPQITPLMSADINSADKLLEGGEFMGNWVQDFVQELRNAALQQPVYAKKGILFTEEILDLFEFHADSVADLRCDMADMLVLVGERERAEAMIEAVLSASPDKSIGYVRLAHALTLRSDSAADLDRAIALLEQAKARPVDDPEDWDLISQLEHFKEKRAQATTA